MLKNAHRSHKLFDLYDNNDTIWAFQATFIQVAENYTYLFTLKPNILQILMNNHTFHSE